MPLYEEKLIAPLAVRFTQQRIRTHFQDGREVEATIKQITVEPGVGDYDIILHAPFPAIEIIRWAPNGRKAGGKDHWLSFDNRRLYCLQRVAAKYWPKRVGAAVEVLYADAGTIRKKLDTQTGGLSVSIGHAFAAPHELDTWDWRLTVAQRAPPGCFALQAEALVNGDDAKVSVKDLWDVPSMPRSCQELRCEVEAEESEMPKEKEAAVCAAEAEQPKDSALSSLIGQLLDLKMSGQVSTEEEALSPTCEDTSSSALESTHLSESSELTEAPSFSSTAVPEEAESVAASDEDKDQHEPLPSDCAALAAQQEHVVEPKAAKQRQRAPVQKDAATARKARAQMTQQWQMGQMAQMQAAHMQAAQMQVAHMQAAQMMQYQHAALAYQAQASKAYQAQAWAAQSGWW